MTDTDRDIVCAIYELLGAVWRKAIRDARHGSRDAKEFLADTLPGWEKLIAHKAKIDLRQIEQAKREALSTAPVDTIC